MGMIRLYAPISKADLQPDGSLIVTGIATTETVDQQGELVEYEGAKAAFEAWPGNVREMHDPTKAVGRALDIMPNDEKREIAVRCRVSAGAADTIEKIRDGTLRGYSIGGTVREGGLVAGKVNGQAVNILRAFDLAELSLVDAPANPDAEISIVKSNVGTKTLHLGGDAMENENARAAGEVAEDLLKMADAPAEPKAEGEAEPKAEGEANGEKMAKLSPELVEMLGVLKEHLTAAAGVVAGVLEEYSETADGGAKSEPAEEKRGEQESEKSAAPAVVAEKAVLGGGVEKALRSELAKVAKRFEEMAARFERIEAAPVKPFPVSNAHAVAKTFGGDAAFGETPDQINKAVEAALSRIGDPSERESARQAALVAAMRDATPAYQGRR